MFESPRGHQHWRIMMSTIKAPKKTINTISDKLVKVGENFTINRYDNGFMIEVQGRDTANEWATAKIMVSTVDELVALVREAVEMEMQS